MSCYLAFKFCSIYLDRTSISMFNNFLKKVVPRESRDSQMVITELFKNGSHGLTVYPEENFV